MSRMSLKKDLGPKDWDADPAFPLLLDQIPRDKNLDVCFAEAYPEQLNSEEGVGPVEIRPVPSEKKAVFEIKA